MELTAIKVKIGLRANGQADHPDFNSLQAVKDSGMDGLNGRYFNSAMTGGMNG